MRQSLVLSCPAARVTEGSRGSLVIILVAVVLMAMMFSFQCSVAMMTIGCRVHSSFYRDEHLFLSLKMHLTLEGVRKH